MREARAVMADLASSGLNAEQLALVMELAAVVSVEARPMVDKSAERRRAKDRERHRVRRNPQISAESADTKVSPTPPSKETPFPPLKGGTSPKDSHEKPLAEPAKALSAWVSEIWEITPRPGRERSGKRNLENALRAADRRGHDLRRVKLGLIAYYASRDATKDGGQFAQGVHVAISSGRWEAFEPLAEHPPPDPDPWSGRLTRWRMASYWNTEWGPKPGTDGYLGPPLEKAA